VYRKKICAKVGHQPSTFRIPTRHFTNVPLLPCASRGCGTYSLTCWVIWDFPAVSVITGWDLPALSVVTGQDFPAVSAVTGRDFPVISVVTCCDFLDVTFPA